MMKIATIVLLGLAVGAEAGSTSTRTDDASAGKADATSASTDAGRGSDTTSVGSGRTTTTDAGRDSTTTVDSGRATSGSETRGGSTSTRTDDASASTADDTDAGRGSNTGNTVRGGTAPVSGSGTRPDSTSTTRSGSTTPEEEEAIVYTPAAEYDMSCKSRCWRGSNRYQQSAAPAVYASSCDTVDNGPRTATTVDSGRTTTTTAPATTTYVRAPSTDTNTNCKYYTKDSNNNKVCWTGSVKGVANAGRRLLGGDGTTYTVAGGSTTQSGCTSTESVNEDGNRVVTTRCTGNTTGTNYVRTPTAVVARTCTQEDFDVQNAMVEASQIKYDLWRASADMNAAVIDYNNHSGYCSCDTLCMSMGDCCDDMGYWCTTGDTIKTMTVSQHYYDFPYPGTMHFGVEEPTVVVVDKPKPIIKYYTLDADGNRVPHTPSGAGGDSGAGGGDYIRIPTNDDNTTTTGRNCYTMNGTVKTPVACPTNTGTTNTGTTTTNTGTTTTTRACSRYSLNDDGSKNCLN